MEKNSSIFSVLINASKKSIDTKRDTFMILDFSIRKNSQQSIDFFDMWQNIIVLFWSEKMYAENSSVSRETHKFLIFQLRKIQRSIDFLVCDKNLSIYSVLTNVFQRKTTSKLKKRILDSWYFTSENSQKSIDNLL